MFDNVIGQDRAKKVLSLLMSAYHRTGKMPHVGFFGPTGLGKTHLVTCWASDISAELVSVNGTAVKNPMAFRALFKQARDNGSKHYVVFIDEAHGMPNSVQENLLSVLEEPAILSTIADKDMGHIQCLTGRKYIHKGDIITEKLPSNLSFAIATTDPIKMKEAVLNRLRRIYLDQYSIDDKIEIVDRHLSSANIETDYSTRESLAQRSRSIRQLRSEICETYIDISALFPQNERLTQLDSILGIDKDGAMDMDRDYMDCVSVNGIVGIDTLVGTIGISKYDIQTRIEPFLLSKGWLDITRSGRKLTEAGQKKLKNESTGTAS